MSNSKNVFKFLDLVKIHHDVIIPPRNPTIIYHDNNGTSELTRTCFYGKYCIPKGFDGQINYSCAENVELLPSSFRLSTFRKLDDSIFAYDSASKSVVKMGLNGLIVKRFTCADFDTFDTDGNNIYCYEYYSVSKIIKLNLDLELIDTKELNVDGTCTQVLKKDEFMCKSFVDEKICAIQIYDLNGNKEYIYDVQYSNDEIFTFNPSDSFHVLNSDLIIVQREDILIFVDIRRRLILCKSRAENLKDIKIINKTEFNICVDGAVRCCYLKNYDVSVLENIVNQKKSNIGVEKLLIEENNVKPNNQVVEESSFGEHVVLDDDDKGFTFGELISVILGFKDICEEL